MKTKNLSKITFTVGLFLLAISKLIPNDSLEFIFGDWLRPLGLITVFINPILGVIGTIFSQMHKQSLYLILNITIIFSWVYI